MGLANLGPGAHAAWRTRTNGQTLIGTAGRGWAPGLAATRVRLSPLPAPGARARQSSAERSFDLRLDIMVGHHSRIAGPSVTMMRASSLGAGASRGRGRRRGRDKVLSAEFLLWRSPQRRERPSTRSDTTRTPLATIDWPLIDTRGCDQISAFLCASFFRPTINHTRRYATSAPISCSRAIGKRRTRTPVACHTALAIAPAVPVIPISPTPLTPSAFT
jgi:hypothetical protein